MHFPLPLPALRARLAHPVSTLALLSSLAASSASSAFAAPPLPLPDGPPPPAAVPGAVRALPAQPGMPAQASPAPVTSGRVTRMLINPYGEVDGLLLDQRVVVKFPPHLAQRLTGAVAPDAQVRIFGIEETAGVIKADAIVNTATGQSVVDLPPALDANAAPPLPPHLRAAQLSQITVRGKVALLLSGPRGETNGVILDDGSIVRFAPEALPFRPDRGMPFAASGMGTRNTYGTAIEAISVASSDGQMQPLYSRLR